MRAALVLLEAFPRAAHGCYLVASCTKALRVSLPAYGVRALCSQGRPSQRSTMRNAVCRWQRRSAPSWTIA